MSNGMALRARTDMLTANIRGVRDVVQPGSAVLHRPLAEVIPLVVAPPALTHPPTTRTLDDKGRLTVRIAGRPLGEILNWEPGPLRFELDGDWILLTQDEHSTSRRHDGRPCLGTDGRLRVPVATRRLLAVEPGDEVAVLVLPEHDAVGLCHPSRLLVGAPLGILNSESSSEEACNG